MFIYPLRFPYMAPKPLWTLTRRAYQPLSAPSELQHGLRAFAPVKQATRRHDGVKTYRITPMRL
jgi:hypothetical protein